MEYTKYVGTNIVLIPCNFYLISNHSLHNAMHYDSCLSFNGKKMI
jgi:hypothetical protein